ncbi:MAG TPA: hypothetical protein ENG36_01305 [Lentisphaerae bacterium]|nr:hypothetical protein [Lentisphaerota bacterium]
MPVLAIREGRFLLCEEVLDVDSHRRFDRCILLKCRGGKRRVYILLRADGGPGMLRIRRMSWSPYNAELLRRAGLRLPAHCGERSAQRSEDTPRRFRLLAVREATLYPERVRLSRRPESRWHPGRRNREER